MDKTTEQPTSTAARPAVAHTAGPWAVDPEPEYQQPGNLPVYSVYEPSSDEEIARVWALVDGSGNAHLIAAAPDLYAVLIEVRDLDAAVGCLPLSDVRARLDAALARAEGRDA